MTRHDKICYLKESIFKDMLDIARLKMNGCKIDRSTGELIKVSFDTVEAECQYFIDRCIEDCKSLLLSTEIN